MIDSCSGCSEPFCGSGMVVFQDETILCPSCIDHHFAVASELKGQVRMIEEPFRTTFRMTFCDIWHREAAFYGPLTLAVVYVLCLLPGLRTGELVKSVIGGAVLCLVLAPFLCGIAAYYANVLYANLPIVSSDGRVIEVRYGGQLVEASLADCTWHEGSIYDMRLFQGFVIHSRQPALVIAIPVAGSYWRGIRVAVGGSTGFASAWRALLGGTASES